MSAAHLEQWFPLLSETEYEVTSPQSTRYNCIAWAVGRDDVFMWPDAMGQMYWPDDAPRQETTEAFIAAFSLLGYTECSSCEHEPGIEKVAVYEKEGKPTHAARQLENGRWSSKCGRAEDIAHSLTGLNGDWYGQIAVVMERTFRTA